MKRAAKLIIGAILVIGVVFGGKYLRDNFFVEVPTYTPIEKVVWLDQNWSAEQREWFHHANQGTLTFGIPYEWFVALEQPTLSFSATGLLSDPSYLDRYGFIPGSTESIKHELPVGFAHGGPMSDESGSPWRNPQTKKDFTGVGLTCAGCHTGRFTFQKTTVLIDGGPALTNLGEFKIGLGLSLWLTRYMPFRFSRFADRVLGLGASDEAKSDLRNQLDTVLAQDAVILKLDEKVKHQSVTEGFARLDALNRIGNTVFALDLKIDANYVGTSAPVHFPRIWNSSWFDWVQYNGSIEQPMVRNAGEALGVAAPINLVGAPKGLFRSGVQIKTLFEIEQLLAGKQPDDRHGFTGLNSPKWPAEVLPPIDTKLAAKGAELYATLCQGCHMPPVTNAAFWASERWTPPNSAGERYLKMELIDIKHIGTDPAQAEDMKSRIVSIPANLGITTSEFGAALGQLVAKTVSYWYDNQNPPVSAASQQEMNGNRENGIQALLKYKVRPLNGIWATPPYLHNGSVPNLYALLSPVAERPTRFYLGDREYDPVNVGFRSDKLNGGFEFDTTIRGNYNTGHEFDNNPNKEGVIGPWLSPDDRWAIIEYLKTL
jgi:hypothetical protein